MTTNNDPRKPADRPDQGVDVEALEEAMDEVVETLGVAEEAAEFVQAVSPEEEERERAAAVQQQAEAMLDAAEESSARHADKNRRPTPTAPSGRLLH